MAKGQGGGQGSEQESTQGKKSGSGGQGGGDDHGGHSEQISLLVNEKPVTIENKKQTGLAIKQAAISQGVQIQSDFVLSIERGGGKTDLIGDDEKITVHNGSRFLAIPNDDNS